MQPDSHDDQNNDRSLQIPPRDQPTPLNSPQRDAAVSILRDRVNNIYEAAPPNQPDSAANAQQSTPQQTEPTQSDAYHRQHNAQASAQHWQQYHSAWQNYYQQYYARYYQAQVLAHQRNIQATLASKEAARPNGTAHVGGPDEQPKARSPKDLIKKELRDKVSERARKVRKSSHFWPVVAALGVGILFLGLQYNKLLSAQVVAYVAPSSARPEDVIINPNADPNVGPEPKIVIPKINVSAPVNYDINTLDEPTIQRALKSGVVKYSLPGASDLPGQKGHTVILGHSSNDVFDDGQYKFIFIRLEQMKEGDTFYLNYKGTRYTYNVTKTQTILPSEVDKLLVKSDKPIVSLVTCVPIGTAQKRFIVTGEQVSPDPSGAKPGTGKAEGSEPKVIPGNNKSFLETVFGG